MHKNILSLLLLVAACAYLPLNAQSNWCGMSPSEAKETMQQMHKNRQEMRGFVRDRGAVTYIPVRFFMVAKSDGSQRTSERSALKALCTINESYADQDIQFYLKEFKYFNNTNVWGNPGSAAGSNAIGNQMIYNALNVFIVNDAGDGAAAYFQPPYGPNGNDWIVASESYVDDVRVLAHEIGHFLSLPHTFYGWEISGGWDPGLHGNPVGNTSPDGDTKNEFVDGTNCNNAGDDICDTPADYMFPSNDCSFTPEAKDPHGDLLEPQLENMMNYHFGCGGYFFTDMQKTEISNSLFSNIRNYVRPNYTPNLNQVTGTPTITAPANQQTIPTYNNVVLEWTAVPNADKYLVEINHLATSNSFNVIVNTNKATLTGLLANSSYTWKVQAFTEYSTCANQTTSKIFKTGNQLATDTSESPALQSWSVTPNPVSNNSPLYINVESINGLKANVNILTLTGQVVQTIKDHQFPGGISTLSIETHNLQSGMYLVAIQTAGEMLTQKVAIVD